jgi:DNA repair protein RadC
MTPEEDPRMSNTIALARQLRSDMPEVFDEAQVVGNWIWLEFTVPPDRVIRSKLKRLGFHWNGHRKCWQHPCGLSRSRSFRDPKSFYPVLPAQSLQLNETAPVATKVAKEYKVISLRECPLPEAMQLCDTPERAAQYWRLHVATNPYFNLECECFTVLMLNTRRRVKGHQLVSMGTMDTLLVHPREVFRAAVIVAAAAVIMMHNHPSGEPQPSESDIKVTRDLIRAGQLMKIEVLDHVIMGADRHVSLRELGYCAV